MNLKSFYRYVFVFLVSVFVFTGCGSDNGSGEFVASSDKLIIKDSVYIIQENNISEIFDKNVVRGSKNIIVSKKLADSLSIDSTFYIPSGIDKRFPLGFSGKIKKITKKSNNKFELKFDDTHLTDVIKKFKQSKITTKLNEKNFLGVIAPSMVSASNEAQNQKLSGKNHKSFFNGGVTFIKKTKIEKSFLGEDGVVSVGEEIALGLQLTIPGSKYEHEPKSELTVTLKGSLSDLELYDQHDYDLISTDPYIEMDLAVKGKLSVSLELEGKTNITLGNFSKEWDEVAEKKFDAFGVSGKLTALNKSDKIGKLPIIGLVFQSITPIPTTSATFAINKVKPGGIIVWVYMNAKGELSLNGKTGIVLATDVTMGVKKQKNSELNAKADINPIDSNTRLLKAPYIEGEGKLQLDLGLSFDVDVFAAGMRFANFGLDFLGRTSIGLRGNASYGLDKLGDDWTTDGRVCVDGKTGIGVLAKASAKIGIEAETIFDNDNFSAEYKNQIPSQNQIDAAPGDTWVKGGIVPMWYKFKSINLCTNNEIPITKGESFVINTSKIKSKKITLNATDKDNDSLTYHIVNQPQGGKLSGTVPKLTYTPNNEHKGRDSFSFTVDDGMKTSKKATIDILVITKDSDLDGDGMFDVWELKYPELDMDNWDADGDIDKDGILNAQEFFDGTDPTDKTDFKLFTLDILNITEKDVEFQWSSRNGAYLNKIYISKSPINTTNENELKKLGYIEDLPLLIAMPDVNEIIKIQKSEYTLNGNKISFVQGIKYYAKLVAYGATAGDSPYRPILSVTDEVDFKLKLVVSAPKNLKVIVKGRSITLEWDKVKDISDYEICMSESIIKDDSKCDKNEDDIVIVRSKVKVFINNPPEDKYYFRVRGVKNGHSSLWSEQKQVSIVQDLSAPNNLRAIATDKSITLKYDKVKDVSAYKICMSESAITDGFKCTENGGKLIGATSTTKTIREGLKKDTTYYFRVRAIKNGFTELWSDEVNAKLIQIIEDSLTLTIDSSDIKTGTAYVHISSSIINSGTITFYDNGQVRDLDDGTTENGYVTLTSGRHIIQVCSTNADGTKCSEEEIIIVAETVDIELYTKLPLEASSNAITNDGISLIYGTTQGKLYSLNIDTKESTFLVDLEEKVSGLFYDKETSLYYYSTVSSGNIYKVSIENMIRTKLYNLRFPDGLDYYKGNLYVVTNDRSGILTILSTQGVKQGTLDTKIDDIVGISHTDKFLYILSEDGDIYQTNSSTGKATKIFTNKGLFEQGNSNAGLEGITVLNNRIYVSYVNDSSVYLIDVDLKDYE